MTKTYSTLADCDGSGQCYGCENYDWAIVFGVDGQKVWQHECNSALGCVPGDNVTGCEGFKIK